MHVIPFVADIEPIRTNRPLSSELPNKNIGIVDEGSHNIGLVVSNRNPSEIHIAALHKGSTITDKRLITSGPSENRNTSHYDSVALHEGSARHINTTGPW